MRRKALLFVAAVVIPTCSSHAQTSETDLAISIFEYGGTVGKVIWDSVNRQNKPDTARPDHYSRIAERIRSDIEYGRSASKVTAGTLGLISTSLAYAATLDPEPLSKGVAAVAAYGAKKAGDALGQKLLDDANKAALGILARGMQNSGLTASDLKAMSADQIRETVSNFQIGSRTLGEELKDLPGAAPILQAASIDVVTNLSVETLAKAEAIGNDVGLIKAELGATSKRLSEYQNAVKKRFYKIDTGLSALHSGVQRLNQSMDSLRTAVGENQAALQGLAAISYSGWSTQQKLQAVRSGSFPGLEGASREATIKALEDQAAVERTAAHLQSVSQDFSDLATIAANIGLPKDLVNGLQGAQVVANGFAAFASGNYLGAVASLTSLVGLGGPDAATQRHEQLMKYLGAQFEQINKKLDYIIDLQKKTLEAIDALAKAQISFRKEVMAKLDKIEGIVLQNNVFLQRIVISKWDSCHAIAYGPMNGLFSLETPASLQKILRWDVLSTMTADCYDTLVKFFDANVKPASWAGQIIAAQEFPTSKIEDNPSLQKHIRALQAQRERAFETARKFLMASIASTQYSLGKPAYLLARLQQPMPDVASAKTLNDALSEPKTRAALESFRCADSTLSHALQTLICVNAADGSNPVEATFRSLLNAPRIGPQAYWIMDLGQVMSTIVDFGVRDNSGNFSFATPEELSRFASVGQSALLRKAVEKGKGIDLLRRLQLLSEAVLLQDALSFGDLTAELVMAALYDPATKALVTDPKALASDIKRQLAVDAMKMNPLLAHNVVMLAMRRSIEQALGGREKANEVLHRRTAYQLALNSYDKRGACSGSSAALQGLKNLFPNWQFEYRVTATDRADAALKSCPEEVVDNLEDVSAPPALGHGPAVTVGDFYVLLPSAPVLSQGMFEQSDNLNLALRYRDKLSQAVIDRRLGSIVSSIDATERNVVALGLLSEGWPATTTLPHQ